MLQSTIIWNVDPRDWSLPGTSAIVSRVLDSAGDGTIILLHDGGGFRAQTVAALPTIITALRSRGYGFVTIEQMVQHLSGHSNAAQVEVGAHGGGVIRVAAKVVPSQVGGEDREDRLAVWKSDDPQLAHRVWMALNTITPEALMRGGRVYGGGLYKMEPNELGNIPADKVLAVLPRAFSEYNEQMRLF
jgi:hypothetical protein